MTLRKTSSIDSPRRTSAKRLFCTMAVGLSLSGVLFGQSALVLSSATAPGGSTVTLNLTMTSAAGSEPSALQWTLGYPTSAISAVSATAGPATSAASKSLSCAASTGSYSCEVSGMNANAIANGVVATIAFTLTPTATSTAITLTNSA